MDVYQRNDERILGDGDFVCRVLASAEDTMKKQYLYRSRGMNLDTIAAKVSKVLEIEEEEVWAKGRYRRIVEARSLLCYWGVRELGLSMSLLSNRLGLSIPSISDSVARGQKIATEKGLTLI